MFIVDDLAMAPFKGVMWLAREIQAAAERAREDELTDITRQLQDLYRQLEAGEIDDDTFDDAEESLLARMDELQGVDEEGDWEEDLEDGAGVAVEVV